VNVFFVVPEWAAQARTGGHYVEHDLVRAVAQSASVHLAVVGDPPLPRPSVALAGFDCFRRRPPGFWDRVLGPLPTLSLWSRGAGLPQKAATVARAVAPCTLLVSRSYAVADLPVNAFARFVVATQNVESQRLSAFAISARGSSGQLWKRLQAARMARLEKRIFASADAVLALSRRDQERLAHLVRPGIPVLFFPPLPDPDLLATPMAPRPDDVLLFVGSLDYPPNTVAAERLLVEIFPRVRAERASARLVIAGSTPSDALRARVAQTPGATLIPDFDALAPLHAAATVFVSPLDAQEGISVKTLAAFAAGTPVVAPRAVLESLGVAHDHVALEGDTSEQIAVELLRLLSSEPLRRDLSGRARETIRERFSPESRRQALTTALGTDDAA